MPTPALSHRALAGAIAVVLAGGIVSAGLGAGAEDSLPELTSGSSTTTTSVAEAADAEAEVAPGATGGGSEGGGDAAATDASEAASGQQAPPAPGPTGATEEPSATAPPRPGTYRYEVTDQEDGQDPESREDEVRIEDVSREGATVRQRLHMDQMFGPAESAVVWTSQGMRVESTRFDAFGGGECDWEPDMEWFRLPLDEGASWQFTSKCTMQVQGMSFEVEITSTVSVGGRSTAEVAGTSVEVVEIRRESTVAISGQGFDGTSNSTETELLAPARGLVVSAEGTWDAQFGAESRSGSSQRRLLQLDPA